MCSAPSDSIVRHSASEGSEARCSLRRALIHACPPCPPQVFCAIWDVRPADRKNLERLLRTWDAIFPAPPLAAIRRRIEATAVAGNTVAAAATGALLPPPAGLHPSLAAVAAAAAGNRMYSVATRGATGAVPRNLAP